MNDAHGLPGKTNSLCFKEITWRGWPYVFVQVTRPIAKHEELLLDYGDVYWGEAALEEKLLMEAHLDGLRKLPFNQGFEKTPINL